MKILLQDNDGNDLDIIENVETYLLNAGSQAITEWIEMHFVVPIWVRRLKVGESVQLVHNGKLEIHKISNLEILDSGKIIINSLECSADDLYSYSYLAIAVRDSLIKLLQDAGPCPVGSDNGWEINGKYYFYEPGASMHDGSLVGSVFSESNIGEEFVTELGLYHISPDGRILRWPASISSQREIAEINGRKVLETNEKD